MRRKRVLGLAPLSLATFTGLACSLPAPSVYSLATEEELVFEESLLGHWVEVEDEGDTSDSEVIYTVTRRGDSLEYGVEVLLDNCEMFEFEAALADLDSERFLILWADPDELLFSVSTYSFLRVKLSPDAIEATMIDPDWLVPHFEAHPEALAHLRRKDLADGVDLLLTASTADLRAFHLAHTETPDAYGQKAVYARLSNAELAAFRESWCGQEGEDPAEDG